MQLGLGQVLWIPVGLAPHKPVQDEPGPAHRLELCRAAIADDPRFEVCALELQRPGPSYTVDTLSELHRTDPDSELHLIVGADAAAGFSSWREPERILSLARLAVARRRGTSWESIQRALAHVRGGERADFFRMPWIGISSTMIRSRVKTGEPLRYLVPDGVGDYILANGLYGGAAGC